MEKYDVLSKAISEELYAKVMGQEILKFVQACDQHALARQVDSEAIRVLQKIRELLNDETLDDPNCFYRIDAIVQTFWNAGITVERHDF